MDVGGRATHGAVAEEVLSGCSLVDFDFDFKSLYCLPKIDEVRGNITWM